MSLNGLDTAIVQEVHQNAVQEPGGWFLLKYSSRDAVALYDRGKGGVLEARTAIAKYAEPSPLYGLLIYRRRKVLIKYIPEGTSLVLQARTTVHFQDVTERYSPFDTLLEISTADGLNDTSLAASFPLHTASFSNSSTRLHEISEDAEDSGAAMRRPQPLGGTSSTMFGSRQHKMEKRVDHIMRTDRVAPPSSLQLPAGHGSFVASPTLSPGKTSISSQILVREDSGKRSITSLSSPKSDSIKSFSTSTAPAEAAREAEGRSSFASDVSRPLPRVSTSSLRRPSTQESSTTITAAEPLLEESKVVTSESLPSPPTSRGGDSLEYTDRVNKSLEEPFDFSYLEAKPKIRHAPRPVSNKRATTTGVSTLPAHYRPQQRKQDFQAPTATPDSPVSTLNYSSFPIPPIPSVKEYDPRPISRGSVKSLPSHKSTTMTPDKVRLMKAVELRKRQLRKSNPSLPASIPGVKPEVPDVPEIPAQQQQQQQQQPKLEARAGKLDELRGELAANKADSGIEMDYRKSDKSTEAKVESAANSSQDAAQTDEPEVREALQNDELKAEAEGYGAVPDEVHDDQQPRLQTYASPRGRRSRDTDSNTPSSKYSTATDLSEAVVESAQAATTALQSLATDNAVPANLPTIVMSPNSPRANMFLEETTSTAQDEMSTNVDEVYDDKLSIHKSPRRQTSDLAKRRRGIVEPLNLEAQSELLADEALMDELQEATVHQATPMAVAKSPVNQYFTRRPSNISLLSAQSTRSDQSTSIQTIRANREQAAEELEKHISLAEPTTALNRRSVSPMDRIDALAGLRRNVSSGITKRFQALTEGYRDGNGSPVTISPAQSQDGSPNDRKIRSPARSRAGSFKGRWGIGERTSSSTIALNTENAPVWSVSQDNNSARDSIHVRARIVRPPSTLESHAEPLNAERPTQLQESKLEISHNVGPDTSFESLPPISTTVASSISNPSPTASRRQWTSASTPLSARPEDFPAPPLSRSTTSATADDASNAGSRTSRFFKRMSTNFGGANKRRSFALQSPMNNNNDVSDQSTRTMSTSTEKDRSDMPPAAALGDLNVQFPDTLLWKRRWLTLDESGSLVLGIPQAMEHHRSMSVKKLHLSEFKLPYIPDLDRQEMPHSICLDLVEGGTLQVACEDGMGQRQVLSMLRSYWKSWVG